jgi:hypothetical protein
MEKTRTVQIFKYHRDEGEIHYKKVSIGYGIFHAWGFGYEEFETGPGNYSTAIIEMPDGSVENISADMIVFLEPLTP